MDDSESRPVRPARTRHLRVVGPVVAHFHGRVESVSGTGRRPTPSTRPIGVAAVALLLALALPAVVALLPLVVLGVLLLVWLRKRGWVHGRARLLPRFRGRDRDAGLTVETFRVRVDGDDDTIPFTELSCRLVRRGDAGPAGLRPGDVVTGRGRRTGGGVVEVSRMAIGESGRTALHAAPLRSTTAVTVVAGALLAAAGVLGYLQWSTLAPLSWESVLSPVLGLLVPLVVLYVLVKILLRR